MVELMKQKGKKYAEIDKNCHILAYKSQNVQKI